METTSIWYWVFRGFIALIAVVGNTTVIGLIVRKRRLRSTPNWFIVSLATADLCVGLLVIPSAFVCTFWASCAWIAQVTFYGIMLHISVGNLCVLTLDRYLVIVHPFRHANLMTRYRRFAFIALAWLIPVVVILSERAVDPLLVSASQKQIISHAYMIILLTCFEAVPCVIMLGVYLRIFCITRQLVNQVVQQEQQIEYNYRNCGNHLREPRSREKSALLAALLVVLIFVACWSLMFYRTLCSTYHLCTVSELCVDISRSLMITTSAANPIVWSLVKRDIRKEFLKLIKLPQMRRTRSVTSEVTGHRKRSQVSVL